MDARLMMVPPEYRLRNQAVHDSPKAAADRLRIGPQSERPTSCRTQSRRAFLDAHVTTTAAGAYRGKNGVAEPGGCLRSMVCVLATGEGGRALFAFFTIRATVGNVTGVIGRLGLFDRHSPCESGDGRFDIAEFGIEKKAHERKPQYGQIEEQIDPSTNANPVGYFGRKIGNDRHDDSESGEEKDNQPVEQSRAEPAEVEQSHQHQEYDENKLNGSHRNILLSNMSVTILMAFHID